MCIRDRPGDEAVVVAGGKINIDEIDVDLEGLGGVDVLFLLGCGGFAGRRRRVGRGRVLGAQGGRRSEQEREREERRGQSHHPIRRWSGGFWRQAADGGEKAAADAPYCPR